MALHHSCLSLICMLQLKRHVKVLYIYEVCKYDEYIYIHIIIYNSQYSTTCIKLHTILILPPQVRVGWLPGDPPPGGPDDVTTPHPRASLRAAGRL